MKHLIIDDSAQNSSIWGVCIGEFRLENLPVSISNVPQRFKSANKLHTILSVSEHKLVFGFGVDEMTLDSYHEKQFGFVFVSCTI